jgi:isocitrate/isopropylmalate dehydrogenase
VGQDEDVDAADRRLFKLDPELLAHRRQQRLGRSRDLGFEPIHGSAFDITGKGIANPVGTFWTAAMMLEHLGEKSAATRLMKAVERVTADPSLHTPDLGGNSKPIGVRQMQQSKISRAETQ